MSIYPSKPKHLSDADIVSATREARKHVKNGEFHHPGLPSSCGKRRYLNISGTEPSSCCIQGLQLLFLCSGLPGNGSAGTEQLVLRQVGLVSVEKNCFCSSDT